MKLLAELWGEHEDFGVGEIRGILEGEDQDYSILEVDYPVILVELENAEPLKRAGLLRRFSEYIYHGNEIPSLKMQLDDYAIRVRKRKKVDEEKIIRSLAKGINGSVNLKNPKNIVRVYIGRKIHIGIEIYNFSNDFERRRAKNLPVTYPITMHPRLARAMINLARVKKGAKILDPFCGTGIILIEGGLMGMTLYGSDIDRRMIEASEINLRKFGLSASLKVEDVGDVKGRYDAIITDPPYGRSSSTRGERIYQLYERAFEQFSHLTSKVVIALPDERAIKIGEKYFQLKEVYIHRVHRSLTRYFLYFQY